MLIDIGMGLGVHIGSNYEVDGQYTDIPRAGESCCNNGTGLQLAGQNIGGSKIKSQVGCFQRSKPSPSKLNKGNKKLIQPFRRQPGPCQCGWLRTFLGLSWSQL